MNKPVRVYITDKNFLDLLAFEMETYNFKTKPKFIIFCLYKLRELRTINSEQKADLKELRNRVKILESENRRLKKTNQF